MSSIRISLETSDFSVERDSNGRTNVMIYGDGHTVELDLDPEVGVDLMVALANPEEPPPMEPIQRVRKEKR